VTVFSDATDDLFSDENLTCPAIYRVGGSGPGKEVRVIFSRPMRDMAFGQSGLIARDIKASVRLSEITSPKRGDTLEVDSIIYRVEEALVESLDLTASLVLVVKS